MYLHRQIICRLLRERMMFNCIHAEVFNEILRTNVKDFLQDN